MPPRPALLVATAALVLAGCGSAPTAELPPPATAPVGAGSGDPSDGHVVAVGGRVVGVGVSADGRRLAAVVADGGGARLLLLDPRGRVRRSVALAAVPGAVAVDVRDDELLLAEGTAVRGVGLGDGRTRRRLELGLRARVLAPLPDGGVAAVDGRGTLAVVAVDGGVRRRPVAPQPTGLAVLDHGRHLAVVSGRARVVEDYAVATLRRTAFLSAGIGPTVATARGRWLFVADTRGRTLIVYRATGGRLLLSRRVGLPGAPAALATQPTPLRLYVALPDRAAVAVLPAHGRPHVLSVLPGPRDPRSVAAGGPVLVGADRALQLLPPGGEDAEEIAARDG